MAYVRYIKKKNGTLVGPYLYKSVRVGDKVVGKFIRRIGPKEYKKFGIKNNKNKTRLKR